MSHFFELNRFREGPAPVEGIELVQIFERTPSVFEWLSQEESLGLVPLVIRQHPLPKERRQRLQVVGLEFSLRRVVRRRAIKGG